MDNLGLRENYDQYDFVECKNHTDREKKKIRLYEMGYHSMRVDDDENGYGLEIIGYRTNEHIRK